MGNSRARFGIAGCLTLLLLAGCPEPADLTPVPDTGDTHWLRFAHLTDVHITDEESPARVIRLDSLFATAWRPQEAYAAQTLDATLRVLNARHAAGAKNGRPLDFVLVTGDMTDNAQYNELRWFLDVMDGQWVTPDSGDADGYLRGGPPEDNPKLGFQAEGLAPDVPWYAALGNHDMSAIGTFAIQYRDWTPEDSCAPMLVVVAGLIGLHDLDPSQNALYATAAASPAVITGAGPPVDTVSLQLELNALDAGPIVPDADRRFLSRGVFVDEHFTTVTGPPGHGFNAANRADGTAFYSVRPKPAAPLRLIVLDTTAPDAPWGLPIEYGVLPRRQFEDFLKPELARAQAAGEYVIIVSHHPSSEFSKPFPTAKVGTFEFRTCLASQPHVIAHLCGHLHRHHAQWIQGEHAYLEIETASLLDFPQEARLMDLFYDETTGTFRLESRMVSHMDDPTRLSEESYRRAERDTAYAKSAELACPEEWEALFPGPAALFGEPEPDEPSIPTQPVGDAREFSVEWTNKRGILAIRPDPS